jgi:hypothetical protein
MIPIAHKDENPYVDAFWKWWPTMYKSLKYFRITGGEPLLSKNTFKVLDYIIENPNPELVVGINTNLCPPAALLDTFIQKIEIIINKGYVKKFEIFTSAEGAGAQAEYIRYGMNYSMWLNNIYTLLDKIPGLNITVMSTYNALSVTGYDEFLKDIFEIKKSFPSKSAWQTAQTRLLLDIPYLRYPPHQSIFILPKKFQVYVERQIEFINNNIEYENGINYGFNKFESEKLKRIYDLFEDNVENEEMIINRKDFAKFVDEHDYRRGTNFLKTFPELSEFYLEIKDKK